MADERGHPAPDRAMQEALGPDSSPPPTLQVIQDIHDDAPRSGSEVRANYIDLGQEDGEEDSDVENSGENGEGEVEIKGKVSLSKSQNGSPLELLNGAQDGNVAMDEEEKDDAGDEIMVQPPAPAASVDGVTIDHEEDQRLLRRGRGRAKAVSEEPDDIQPPIRRSRGRPKGSSKRDPVPGAGMFKVAPPKPETTTKATAGKKRKLDAVIKEAEEPEATPESPSPPKRTRGRPKKTLNAVDANQLPKKMVVDEPVGISNHQSQRKTRAAVGISGAAQVPIPAPVSASVEVVIPPPSLTRKTRGRPRKAINNNTNATETASVPTTTAAATDAQMQVQLQAQTEARAEALVQDSETKTWNMHSFTLMMHPAEEEGGRPVILGSFELVPARLANLADGNGGSDAGATGKAKGKGKAKSGKGKAAATNAKGTVAETDMNGTVNGVSGASNGVKGFEVQVIRTGGDGEEEEMVMLDELDGRARLRVDFRGEVI